MHSFSNAAKQSLRCFKSHVPSWQYVSFVCASVSVGRSQRLLLSQLWRNMSRHVYTYTSTQRSCCVDNPLCELVHGRGDPTGKSSCCFKTLSLALVESSATLFHKAQTLVQRLLFLWWKLKAVMSNPLIEYWGLKSWWKPGFAQFLHFDILWPFGIISCFDSSY